MLELPRGNRGDGNTLPASWFRKGLRTIFDTGWTVLEGDRYLYMLIKKPRQG
jgi:hypothetical protein